MFQNDALKSYSLATLKAEKFLSPAHPTRLSIALNYSVFHWECMNDRAAALKMLNDIMEIAPDAMEEIEDEAEGTDATTLLELINENIEMWDEMIFNEQQAEKEDEAIPETQDLLTAPQT